MHDVVSIILVTCGKNDYYIPCLMSIRAQTHQAIEVILIDNSLLPVLPEKAREIYPQLKIYTSEKNLYYCDSMNKGILHSRGAYILCLNDDVTLAPDFLEKALKGFLESEQVGMVSGKILRQDRHTVDSTGLFLTAWRTARERGYGAADRGQFERAGYIFGVSGAAALYRRKMLEDVRLGGVWFDPVFRIFFEDLDVAWRGYRRGWRGYYVPGAVAYHVRGGSVRQGPGFGKSFARQYLSDDLHVDLVKNRYLTMMRNETWRSFLIFMIPVFWHDLCAWGYILLFKRHLAGRILADLSKALRSGRQSVLSQESKA
ncbi:MAG: glycosyltransferase [Candidatus Omnitrophota bacterium]